VGDGILHRGDTKFLLLTHIVSSYGEGMPAALLFAIVLRLGEQSVFATRASRAGKNDEFFLLEGNREIHSKRTVVNQC